MLEETLILFRNIRTSGYEGTLDSYRKAGGYQSLQKALAM